MEASPAPSATPAVSTAHNVVNRNSMANPAGLGAGAPVRNFLNESIGGWVKRAMLAVWDARPQYPLTWVGEYLISCDIKYNESPATEAQKHFLYHSEGIKSPAEETPARGTPPTQASQQQNTVAAAIATAQDGTSAMNGTNSADDDMAEVKAEEHDASTAEHQVNGIADQEDQEMQDA